MAEECEKGKSLLELWKRENLSYTNTDTQRFVHSIEISRFIPSFSARLLTYLPRYLKFASLELK